MEYHPYNLLTTLVLCHVMPKIGWVARWFGLWFYKPVPHCTTAHIVHVGGCLAFGEGELKQPTLIAGL